MDQERFALTVLEFPRVRELMGRFVVSPLARGLIAELVPFATREQMQTALAQASEMSAYQRDGGRLPLSAISDIRTWVDELRGGTSRPTAKYLSELLRVLRSTSRLRRLLGGLEDHPALADLGERLPELDSLLETVENTVDDRGEVLSSASPRLGELRTLIKKAENEIHIKIQRVVQKSTVRKALQTSQVAWRNSRPVLQVKADSRGAVEGIVHDRSSTGHTVFVEPAELVEVTNRLGELKANESAEIQRLLAELVRIIVGSADDLGRALRGLAWIDFTAARARLVNDLGFVVPELADAGRFRLRQARHPLLLVDLWTGARPRADVETEVVALELDIGDPYTMLVITGPNTGGKTVSLKTLGLLTLMAQAGVPVPAGEGTALPFVDGVFADIGDEQAIEQNLSTFSSHMTRVKHLLDCATRESLVLLDELGAGTDPEEGGALGYAILEQLHDSKVPTMASTHLSRLKDFAYQHEGVENGAMSFDPDTLEPLFQLELGIPGSSNALHIARRVGLAATIVDRASSLLGERDRSLEDVIDRVQRTRKAAEAHRREAEASKLAAADEEQAVREKAEELARRETWLEEEAEHFVDEELRAARELLSEPLGKFVNAPAPYGELAEGMQKLIAGLLSHSSLARRRRKFLESVRKGSFVYVPRFRRRCKVLKVDRKQEALKLEVGDLQMSLPFDDVSWLQPLDGG